MHRKNAPAVHSIGSFLLPNVHRCRARHQKHTFLVHLSRQCARFVGGVLEEKTRDSRRRCVFSTHFLHAHEKCTVHRQRADDAAASLRSDLARLLHDFPVSTVRKRSRHLGRVRWPRARAFPRTQKKLHREQRSGGNAGNARGIRDLARQKKKHPVTGTGHGNTNGNNMENLQDGSGHGQQ